MHTVNDYWMEHFAHKVAGAGWTGAVYHMGNMAMYAASGDQKYVDFSQHWAHANHWEINPAVDPETTLTTASADDEGLNGVLWCWGVFTGWARGGKTPRGDLYNAV
jgi:hypothetical protein